MPHTNYYGSPLVHYSLLLHFFLTIFFSFSCSGIRRQNDSLIMVYHHDQTVAVGKYMLNDILCTFLLNSSFTLSTIANH